MTTLTDSLWQTYRKTGDPAARNELLDQYLGLVHHVARQIKERLPEEVELDDLVSAGTLGLVMALDSFDAERGLAFSTYATPRIRGAILDDLRSRDWVPRSVRSKGRKVAAAVSELQGRLGRAPSPEEIAYVLEIDVATYWRWKEEIDGAVLLPFEGSVVPNESESLTLEETLADQRAETPGDGLTHEEQVERLRDAVASLGAKERTVLALYYYEELNLRQIAEVMHLTESRISQIRSQALRQLRARLRKM